MEEYFYGIHAHIAANVIVYDNHQAPDHVISHLELARKIGDGFYSTHYVLKIHNQFLDEPVDVVELAQLCHSAALNGQDIVLYPFAFGPVLPHMIVRIIQTFACTRSEAHDCAIHASEREKFIVAAHMAAVARRLPSIAHVEHDGDTRVSFFVTDPAIRLATQNESDYAHSNYRIIVKSRPDDTLISFTSSDYEESDEEDAPIALLTDVFGRLYTRLPPAPAEYPLDAERARRMARWPRSPRVPL